MCFFLKNKARSNKVLILSKDVFAGLRYFSPNQKSDEKERKDADTDCIQQGVKGRHRPSERIFLCGIISCKLVDNISTTFVLLKC